MIRFNNIVIWIREQSLNMGLGREEVLASPLARWCYRSLDTCASQIPLSVLWRSSLGSHRERFPVVYYLVNPDATPFYPSCNSIVQSSPLNLHSINHISLLSPAYIEEPYISMSEIPEEPATQDSDAPEELHSSEG